VERTEEGVWQLAIDERTRGRFVGWRTLGQGERVERPALNLWEIDPETEESLEASFGPPRLPGLDVGQRAMKSSGRRLKTPI
jgi:hypothetical protein